MKVKLQLFVYFEKWEYDRIGKFVVFCFNVPDTAYRTLVCEREVEVEVPDNYDPTQQQIASLQAQHDLAFTQFSELAADIKNKISKLQALEYTV